VGLPDAAVRESRDRVRAALKNCGYDIPPTQITFNLAPADIKKEGSGFDLPMALGIVGAYGGLTKKEISDCLLWESCRWMGCSQCSRRSAHCGRSPRTEDLAYGGPSS
jgi:predicted ATPase with chaperone activity